jgi:glycerol-3-phosphate dehydrogenase|tara:strand:+ start:6974 stop:8713 length:1740 start_codon:yes stop_codon:yes gene_type:complete
VNIEHLTNIQEGEQYDVVIIGGGINGIGTYRELALQGLKVLLIEKYDFCNGASSSPSRMIHGGLRYMENAEFDLVRESLDERNLLLKNAPHLVKPLRTIVPLDSHLAGIKAAVLRFFGRTQPTSERGSLIVKIGLTLYDVFTRKDRVFPRHQFYGKQQTHLRFPRMRESVKCVAEYYDAWITSPERLAMELVNEGNEIQGAKYAINHCEASFSDDKTITLTSKLENETRRISAQVIVNATGAWIDEVNESMGFRSEFITGTKGSHIVVDNQELHDELAGSMIYYENTENRVCILFPYMGKVLIGSTDLPVTDLTDVRCTDDEVDYILASLHTILPGITVDKEQIVYKFSGVRPLGSASKETAGQIPRSHQLQVSNVNGQIILSLVGGKWTTFRAFSEQVTTEVLSILDKERRCSTREKHIGGGRGYPTSPEEIEKFITKLHVLYSTKVAHISILFDRYGTDIKNILEYSGNKELTKLSTLDEYFVEEIQYLIELESTFHLEDLVVRRTNLAIEGRLNNNVLIEVALLMKNQLGWDDSILIAQLEHCSKRLCDQNGCDLNAESIATQYKNVINNGEVLCS